MNDYRTIRLSPQFRRLRASDTAAIHRQQRSWLEQELTRLQGQTVVIITHHAPSIQSIEPSRMSDLLTAAYASNLEQLIIKYKPAYWVHGHTHKSSHYKIGSTNVICNPRGYDPDALNLNFNEWQVIEIP